MSKDNGIKQPYTMSIDNDYYTFYTRHGSNFFINTQNLNGFSHVLHWFVTVVDENKRVRQNRDSKVNTYTN